MISTGIRYLDSVTGGLQLGDNVVWEVSSGVPVEYFIRGFFEKSDNNSFNVIIISFNVSPVTIAKRYGFLFPHYRVTLVDAFTHGKGNSDPVFLDFYGEKQEVDALLVQDPKNPTAFIKVMNEIEVSHRDGSFYIFDSLTGMNELWKDEHAVLDFFIYTCPKLYDLNTLAYWMLEHDAHSKEFLAGLIHTTQVVFSVSPARADHYKLVVKKLQSRPFASDFGPHFFTIVNAEVQFRERKREGILGIGERVKELRRSAGMTQIELASRIVMTPGAVSQIENEITTPSLQTLLQLSTIFGKTVDYLVGNETITGTRNFSVYHKPSILPWKDETVSITRLVDGTDMNCNPFLVVLQPGVTVKGSILLHKGGEFIAVSSGSVTITVEGENFTLIRGESLHLKNSFAECWYAGSRGCELFYVLL